MATDIIKLRGSREIAWLAFFAAILAAWWMVFAMARGDADWLCGPDVIAALPLGGFPALLPMWLLMTAAMMLPTIIPTLATYLNLPRGSGASIAGWWAIVAGYSAIWGAVSVGFAGLQAILLGKGILDPQGALSSPWLIAALLALAGGWQFTRGKEICQTACLSPMSFFTGRFRPGIAGGFAMGSEIGMTCVGCCWAIMALAFAGGMTSLWFMGLATAFMVAEKLPQLGLLLRKPAGVGLMAAAAYTALTAVH